jgi:pyruvate formate lyase activating enzyme
MIMPAAYYRKLEDDKVICELCPADCLLTKGKHGICRSRYNLDGELVTDNYGELVTLAVDPIEKKPLYHFYPGADIVSTGPNCCNLGCRHCQNWQIAKEKTTTFYLSPEKLAATALKYQSVGVAFTYTEPMVWFEYIMDAAPLLREAGLKVVLVSNGYINPDPLEQLLTVTDAMNIDVKSMSPKFYKRICKGKLQPVLDNVRRIGESPVHLEITNLLVPGENDSEAEIVELIDFVASISETIPLHFSAYYPSYKMDKEATSPSSLIRAKQLARESLSYVYLGNVSVAEGSDTFCPNCGSLLIQRTGYRTLIKGLDGSACTDCGYVTNIRR